MAETYYYAIGRRKEAVATVRLYSGKGTTMINDQPAETYLNNATLMAELNRALVQTGNAEKMYATIKVNGGGKRGQAEAARLAIARALLEVNQEMRPGLKKAGLLTRDPREKERKKPGLKRARKAPQFSKR